jgi:hypothetical protein
MAIIITETTWSLPAADGVAVIYGVLNSAVAQGAPVNRKAILHVHGLGGDIFNVAPTVMSQHMPTLGYDVIRISLYKDADKARCLTDCTLAIHAADIQTVARHFAPRYDQLFATGHSYGGPSLMIGDLTPFAAVSLWDPTYIPQEIIANSPAVRPLGENFVKRYGAEVVLGTAMVEESRQLDEARMIAFAAACTTPLQVLHASGGYWLERYGATSYHTHAKGPTDYAVIDGTAHCFYEQGTTQKLLSAVQSWFDQF